MDTVLFFVDPKLKIGRRWGGGAQLPRETVARLCTLQPTATGDRRKRGDQPVLLLFWLTD